MSIFEQLSLMSNYFLIKHHEITVNLNATQKLVDFDNTRIYLALNYLTTTGPINFAPFALNSASQGYPTQSSNLILEFWIEKHKALVQQAWFAFLSGGAALVVEVIEMCYALPEKTNEGTLNGNKA